MSPWYWTLAQTPEVPDLTGGIAQIISTGLVGVFFLMVIFEYGVMTTRAGKRDRERAERAEAIVDQKDQQIEAERRAHNETRALVFDALTRDVMPAVTRITDTASRATVALEALTRRGTRDG